MEKETPEKEQPAELLIPEKCVDSKKAEKGKWKALMFDLESGGEEQIAENNKKEGKWGKENKKEEVRVLGNTVQMELAVVAEESSSRAVAKSELKEKPEKQRGAKSEAQIRLRNQEKTEAQNELRVMGNAAEFGAERLPEEELPKVGLQTPSKASEVSEKLPVAVGEETEHEAEAKWKCLQMREEELSVRESEHAFGGLPSEVSRPETEQTGEAGWNEYSLEGIPEGYSKGVQVDESLNPKFRVAELGKFYNRRIRKKLGNIKGCVVGRGALCAKFVSC